ncbi:MAG: SDR family oxidoreductase [Gammaproteobacteria bacterium]|nr:SDR family oxidoreductase [Gammaproteobacteria bacterium]
MNINRVAFITGANKGLGFEICRQLGHLGIQLWVACRDPKKGLESAKKLQALGYEANFIELDLGNPITFVAAFQEIEKKHGRLDILVNNAGVVLDNNYNATNLPISILRETFDTNFFGLVELTQTLLPLIRLSPSGRIVNHSSILGSLNLHSDPSSTIYHYKILAYNSSKTALNAFTTHLAYELRNTKIKVNSAHPGSVVTDLNPSGLLTVEEGAQTAVRLATLPEDGPNGKYFFKDQELPW